jgi:hypothetical protein
LEDNVPLVHISFEDLDCSGQVDASIGSTDEQALASECLCLSGSNESLTSQQTNSTYNTKCPLTSMLPCTPEEEFTVPKTDTQGNTTTQFQLRPTSFSLSPDSASDDISDDQRLEPEPEESFISQPTIKLDMKKNPPISVEEFNSPTIPLYDREENLYYRPGQKVEELVAAATITEQLKDHDKEGVEQRQLDDVLSVEGIDQGMKFLMQEMEENYTNIGGGDGMVGEALRDMMEGM